MVLAVTALLLLGTGGLSLSRMTCLKGGFSVYTLGTSFAECGMEEMPSIPAWRAECCTFGQVVVDQPQFQLGRAMVLCAPVMYAGLHGSVSLFLPREECRRDTDHRSPPLPSSERRQLFGVYRI